MKARRCRNGANHSELDYCPSEEKRPKPDWGKTVRDTVTFLGSLAMTTLLIMQVLE